MAATRAKRGPMGFDHRAKIGAGRLGVSVSEYLAHLNAGELRCGVGQHWVSADQMVSTHTRPPRRCRACNREYRREWHRRRAAALTGAD